MKNNTSKPPSLIVSNLPKGEDTDIIVQKLLYLFESSNNSKLLFKILSIRPTTFPEDNTRCVGYAVVDFATYEDALAASELMKANLVLPGTRSTLKVSWSNSLSRPRILEDFSIFIDGIPFYYSENSLLSHMKFYLPFIVSLKIIPYEESETCYGLLELDDSIVTEDATMLLNEMSRLTQLNCSFHPIPRKLFENTQDRENSSIFVTNLNIGVAERDIYQAFNCFGKIFSIEYYEEKRFCFIHFAERVSALAALVKMENKKIKKQKIFCTWAIKRKMLDEEEEDLRQRYDVSLNDDALTIKKNDLLSHTTNKFGCIKSHCDMVQNFKKTILQSQNSYIPNSEAEEIFWLSLYVDNPMINANEIVVKNRLTF